MKTSVRAIFRALDFVHPEPPALSKGEWRDLLAFCDRTQLTLFLSRVSTPAWVNDAIESRRSKNLERLKRLLEAHQEILTLLKRSGIDVVVLKGLTHAATLNADLALRVQYDIDLLCEPGSEAAINAALVSVGYLSHHSRALSDQHAPPLVRPTKWTWRGDYFDPEIPISIDVHPRLWNPESDRLAVAGMDDCWRRRTVVEVEGLKLPSLAACDAATFAALHAVRHILRSDARPAHIYELARAAPIATGMLEKIALRFAHDWFGAAEKPNLPHAIETWFHQFAWSPIMNLIAPNKDVVWLHVAMLRSGSDRISVLQRRLFPMAPPSRAKAPQRTWLAYPALVASRVSYHARAIVPTLWSGLRWYVRSNTVSRKSHTSER